MAMQIDAVTGFYPSPNSLIPLSPHLHNGLLIVGSLAVVSILVTFITLISIAFQYIVGGKHATRSSSYNQCVTLLANLLIADLIQSISFSISFHWRAVNGIQAPTTYCYVQAGFLNGGDLASGSFVLIIALHTAYSVIRKKTIVHKHFIRIVIAVWIVATIMTISGPLARGADFFARAGNWVCLL